MENRYFDEKNRFVIDDYSNKKPFSSFLPGIAGTDGTPLWLFYVNRGQGVCSFGIRDKNSAIMEFHPANKAYQNVGLTGFRTFIKIKGTEKNEFYEPFSSFNRGSCIKNRMLLGANELEMEELDGARGIKTNVVYFTMPGEDLAALVRQVTITNTSSEEQSIEVVDGMPCILPSGINNTAWKEISHTLKAWMSVINLDKDMPFFKLRASTEDSTKVSEIKDGNFSMGFSLVQGKEELLKPIIDADIVFGNNTALTQPDNFIQKPLTELYNMEQVTSNKVPCSFYGLNVILRPNESMELYSITGFARELEVLNARKERYVSVGFIENKRIQAQTLVRELTEDIYTKTSNSIFDEYCRQTYLDNLLRGGYPIVVGDQKSQLVSHVYSRKHGDIERDYNFFSLEPGYYSSGNGNYRDVNQNRRCDVYFHPELGTLNVKTFVDMLQNDGYNPLVINGYKFTVKKHRGKIFDPQIEEFITSHFTLGDLFKFIKFSKSEEDSHKTFNAILSECDELIDISHGEGYWIDHFTYNIDLIEGYLNIYPDKKKKLLFEETYTYYDSDVFVKPRSEKYVLIEGKIRQYGAELHDKDKKAFIEGRADNKHWLRDKKGYGDVIKVSLLTKLINLCIVKFATLDPDGMGIEMEAGKPGWNDALNGLPGIFGSSMPESYELQYLFEFLMNLGDECNESIVKIPVEVMELLDTILNCIEKLDKLDGDNGNYEYWDKVSIAREKYRKEVFYGFEGTMKELPFKLLLDSIAVMHKKLQDGIDKGIEENNGIIPTYFYYTITDYENLRDEKGIHKTGESGLPLVRPKAFDRQKLPLFLEGFVRAMKLNRGAETAKHIYKTVRESELYDSKLGMYKLNASLKNESMEIGRLRAFTPGWLENETIWLHMEYKYMLELLKSGLYDEFYDDFKKVMIPYLDPIVYGRSILENSSFIASSSNPDKNTHGAGYVARLSGAAAEFLSIWNIMMAGVKPFEKGEEGLVLILKPILPEWLFDDENKISFRFLGKTLVTFFNPGRANTWELEASRKIKVYYKDCDPIIVNGSRIPVPYSTDVRNGKIRKIEIEL